MRNLKKVLALVMAAAMSLTMVAGAKFTDESEIKSLEAVNTLAAVGIIKGYADGSYQADKIVTRAEMAKMIYTLRNGGSDDASMYANLPTTFTDINGHWAASYIKYAQSLGIIAGKSVTKFMPDASVTGMEAAKMLLVVAGYAADKANLTGPSWALNTSVLAAENGLFNGYGTDVAGAAPRQYAAQIIYNAFDMDTVKYSKDSDSFVSETTDKKNSDIKTKYLKMQTVIGNFTGNDKFGGTGNNGEITLQVTSDTGSATVIAAGGTPKQAKFATDLSLIGEEVKLIYKESNSGSAGLDNSDFVFGMTATGGTKVYNITRGDLQTADSNKIKFGDKNYSLKSGGAGGTPTADKIDVVTNFNSAHSDTIDDLDPNTAVSGFNAKYKADSADTIKFVTDVNGNLATAYVTTKTYSKVTSVGATTYQLEGIASIKIEDAKAYEGIAKDDMVYVTDMYNTANREVVITKATAIEGKIDVLRGNNEVQVNGTWYKLSVNSEVITDYNKSNPTLGDTYKFVLDGKYWVAAKAVTTSAKDYAMVIAAGTGIDTQVKMLLGDGTEKVVYVDSDSDTTSKNAAIHLATNKGYADHFMVAYEITGGGLKVKMTSTTKNTSLPTYNKDSRVVAVNGTTALSDTAAVAFLYSTDDAKWKAFKVSDMGNLVGPNSKSDVTFNKVTDGLMAAFSGKVQSFPTGASDKTNYGYVLNNGDKYKTGDDNFTQFDVWTSGGAATIKVSGHNVGLKKGAFISFPVTDKIVSSNEVDQTPGTNGQGFKKIKEYNTDRQTITTTTGLFAADGTWAGDVESYYRVTDDTKIIYVNSKDRKGVESGSIRLANRTSGSDYNNVYIAFDNTSTSGVNKIEAIYVDVNTNEMYDENDGRTGNTGNIFTVGAPTVKNAAVSGVTVTATADKTAVVAGETITVTVKVPANPTKKVTVSLTGSNLSNVVNTSSNATVNAGEVSETLVIFTGKATASTTLVVDNLATIVAPSLAVVKPTINSMPTLTPGTTNADLLATTKTSTIVEKYQDVAATSIVWTPDSEASDATKWENNEKPILTVTYTAPDGYEFATGVTNASFTTFDADYTVAVPTSSATTIVVTYTAGTALS